MSERVIGLSGKTVEVAKSTDFDLRPAEPVDDLYFDQPDDYSEITAALMSIKGRYNELLASLREAGLLKEME